MKIYVASAFQNQAEVHVVQELLRKAGHKITHDWTLRNASHLTPNTPEFFAFLEECGGEDFDGIIKADRLVVIAHPSMSDTKVEIGIALGVGVPVYVLYPERAHSVFYGLVHKVDSIVDLLTQLGQ